MTCPETEAAWGHTFFHCPCSKMYASEHALTVISRDVVSLRNLLPLWFFLLLFVVPPSTRRAADSCTWHGPGDPGWISGRPPGQRHGRASGRIIGDYDHHREADWRQRQPPSLQTEWVLLLSDQFTVDCLHISVTQCACERVCWHRLKWLNIL